ncbi:MAG: hypothetical protein HXY34_11935 [Candidatus Thorarchaeota archaeon]|nr:hypothetical protein [Candidatus Thorarchaeota archaeon]
MPHPILGCTISEEVPSLKHPVLDLVILLLIMTSSPFVNMSHPADTGSMATADGLLSKNVLFDEAHTANGSSLWAPGNASLFGWMLGVNGYNSSTNFDQALDSGVLTGYDILVIFFPMIALTASEVEAVHAFVRNGGGLVLVGADSDNWWGFSGKNLNPISEDYGVIFNEDKTRDTTSSFVAHSLTVGVTDLLIQGDQLFGCSLEVTGNATTVVTKDGKSIVAIAEAGAGRVVFSGAPGPFYVYRQRSYGHGDSHFQFSLNVIDWVAHNTQRTAVIPELAAVRAGTGPSLGTTELQEYSMFVGLIHDHTTHSDGADTPESMLAAGLNKGLDFMVITDHAHKNPTPIEGVTGAMAVRDIAQPHGLDVHIVVGAELSSVHHTVAFPLTENIWTSSQQEAVDQAHGQGAIAILCHPTIDASYADTYERFDDYGYDAVEIVNTGYFYGGEAAYFKNFVGASDGHSASFVGQVLNAVFVQNPSGPNGQIADADLVDAILNRRLVILDRVNNMVFGQAVWVNRYLELMSLAETQLETAQDTIAAISSTTSIGLSEAYLQAASVALDSWNPSRASRLAINATSEEALGIDIQMDAAVYVEPNTQFPLLFRIRNNHTYPISMNTSMCALHSLTVDTVTQTVVAGANNSETYTRTGTSDDGGFVEYWLNIVSINLTSYLSPVLLTHTGVIDNVTHKINPAASGNSITITYHTDALSRGRISAVNLVYDDGSGEKSVAMSVGWTTYEKTLGPYTSSTNVTFRVVIVDDANHTYNLRTRVVEIVSETGGVVLDPMTLSVGVGVLIAVVALVVVLKRRGVV